MHVLMKAVFSSRFLQRLLLLMCAGPVGSDPEVYERKKSSTLRIVIECETRTTAEAILATHRTEVYILQRDFTCKNLAVKLVRILLTYLSKEAS